MFLFYCLPLKVHSSFAIILMRKRELNVLLNLPSWWLMIAVWLFLAVPWGCLLFLIVVFPKYSLTIYDHVLKKFNVEFLPQQQGQGIGMGSAHIIFATMLLHYVIPFILICNMAMF